VALKTAQFVAMSVDQIVALSTAQIVAMETTDLSALLTDQIQALTTGQIVAMATAQFAALHTDQLQALSMSQVAAMTVDQTNALTTAQQAYLTTASPLILDLNGDGVSTLGFAAGVKFDIFANGTPVNTGWVSSSDGLLVLDRNHDGQITDGSELFGTSTRLANGAQAPDGYAALRAFDGNADGVIDSKDAIYADLRVWVDRNSDATSQAGELKTLAAAGVASMGLQSTATLSKDNGNLIGLTSTYQGTDGSTHAAADVWFVADKFAPAGLASAAVDSAIAALNVAPRRTSVANQYASLRSTDFPVAASTHRPMAFSPAPWDDKLVVPPLAALVPTAPEAQPGDIRASVSSLAQAIGSFDSIASAKRATDGAPVDSPRSPAVAATPVALTVASMVDVMKRFDSNGNALIATGQAATSLGKTLNLPGVADSARNGILASNGG
jgi:hypothetical protein